MPTGTFHQNQLDVRCRVCGRKRDPGRTHKLVGDIVPELLSSFTVDVVEDVDDRHPRRICSTCFSYVRAATSHHGNRSPSTSIVPKKDWPQCTGDDCHLCHQWKEESKGGRPRKQKSTKRGRPSSAPESCAIASSSPVEDPSTQEPTCSMSDQAEKATGRIEQDPQMQSCSLSDILDAPVDKPMSSHNLTMFRNEPSGRMDGQQISQSSR